MSIDLAINVPCTLGKKEAIVVSLFFKNLGHILIRKQPIVIRSEIEVVLGGVNGNTKRLLWTRVGTEASPDL